MSASHPWDEERAAAIAGLLAAAGYPAEPRLLQPLPSDASFRRYFRLSLPGRPPVLLMDAPPERERVGPFVAIARHLRALDLAAPAIHAVNEPAGLVLLQDFGDRTFTRLLDDGAAPHALYEEAVDLLIHLHRHDDALALDVPGYATGPLLEEVALLADWYVPDLTGLPTSASEREAWVQLWREALAPVSGPGSALVLRDYHVDNLMRVDHGPERGRLGLLDFQDALIGHPAYDLMSLIEDARRDVDPALASRLRERYARAMGADPGFERAFDLLAAQRHAKVLGIFVRLDRRDGKPGYRRHLPRVRRLFDAALDRAGLAGVKGWLTRMGAG